MKAKAGLIALVGVSLATPACTPDWATNGQAPVVLLLTGINTGNVIDSDVRISNGSVCPDFATLRVENHFKNPNQPTTGFRHDITIERYEVHYIRSDGRSTEGVDVPFSISGNLAQEVLEAGAGELSVEIVRRQAKLDPPLRNLVGFGGEQILTMFADITIHARTTTGQTTNPATARVQVDFADFVDTDTACKVQ